MNAFVFKRGSAGSIVSMLCIRKTPSTHAIADMHQLSVAGIRMSPMCSDDCTDKNDIIPTYTRRSCLPSRRCKTLSRQVNSSW